jgi:hypothetical protein
VLFIPFKMPPSLPPRPPKIYMCVYVVAVGEWVGFNTVEEGGGGWRRVGTISTGLTSAIA